MGRPTIFKKGAMTPAERQRRRGKKLPKPPKAAKRKGKQAENSRKYHARPNEKVEWVSIARAPLPFSVDGLVSQVADALLAQRVGADEFRAVFNKRFPVHLKDKGEKVGKLIWLTTGAIVGAAGLFLLYAPTNNAPIAPTTTFSRETILETSIKQTIPKPGRMEALPELSVIEAIPEPLESETAGQAKTQRGATPPAQGANPSTPAPRPPAATAAYLNGSLPNSGPVPGPANYNDYYGLNGGSECQQPIYDKWGNVSGFRKGNC